MAPLKELKYVKIAFITVILALMLFVEPVLAAKKDNKNNTSRKSSPQKQQAARPPSAPRIQRPSNAGKARNPVVSSSRPSSSSSRPNVSRPSGRGASVGTIRSPGRSPGRAISSRQSINRAPSQLVASKPAIVSSNQRPSSYSVGNKKAASVSPNAGRQVSLDASNRIRSSKSLRINSWNGTNRPKISVQQRAPAESSVNRVSPDKTLRIGSRISINRPTISTLQKPSIGSFGNRINSDKTSQIFSRIETSRPTKSTEQNASIERPDSLISSSKTSRIGSKITTNRPVKSTQHNTPFGRSGNRVNPDKTSRSINRKDFERHSKVSVEEKTAPDAVQNRDGKKISDKSSSRVNRKADSVDKVSGTETLSSRRHKGEGLRIKERLLPSTGLRKSVQERHTTIVKDNNKRDRIGLRGHGREGSLHIRYHDRPDSVRHVHRYEHVFRDWRNRFCHKIVWPQYRFVVRYDYGPWFTFRYVYPYYHRKYIFVSLGGYWPIEYRYRRYYWYGCHPYIWSGYYPIAREVKGDTYNYYTYNYYYDDNDPVTYGASQATDIGYITPVDHNTFADVREKLAQQAAEEPALPGLADVCFEDAVKAFEVDDYEVAIERFAEAMELAPEDVVLPFAYSQALLADKRYPEAAEALRIALLNVPNDKEGVFYPRGLYADDNTLFEQIDDLAEEAELYSYDADLQLLLGYQLLGVGEINEAAGPLQQASLDLENADAANILLALLEKIRVESSVTENINP